jgi:uncharacterized protein (TIGR03000 family)
MFRTSHTLGCILALSVVMVLVTPGLSQAQRGGHGGGGHYGGAHVGGYHGAVHVGGYHAGAYHSGYHYGDGRYYGGYRYPYAHYGYRPYYGSYGYYPYLYNTYPSYDFGYSGSYDAGPLYYGGAAYSTPSSDTYQAFYPPPAVIPTDTSAHINVTVPADAEIWFDDNKTTSTGSVRQFNSPPLTAGKHSYEIRARWRENGREVTQTQQVEVTPSAHVSVSFPVPLKTAK